MTCEGTKRIKDAKDKMDKIFDEMKDYSDAGNHEMANRKAEELHEYWNNKVCPLISRYLKVEL